MKRFPPTSELTPECFEHQVKAWLESAANTLEDFSAKHLESIPGVDGEYVFDVTARFRALGGATFLLVAECKKHKNPIKREVIQILRDKQLSVGAQKAMVFSTSAFQSGAIEYASQHNISLVQIISGQARYIQASTTKEFRLPPENAEDFAGFFYGPTPNGHLIYPELLTINSSSNLARFLGVEE